MISVSKVSKQYGPQILYKNASFQLNPGEKMAWWDLTEPEKPPFSK
jgi:ABC-type phosphonate transport system ATPase subunit